MKQYKLKHRTITFLSTIVPATALLITTIALATSTSKGGEETTVTLEEWLAEFKKISDAFQADSKTLTESEIHATYDWQTKTITDATTSIGFNKNLTVKIDGEPHTIAGSELSWEYMSWLLPNIPNKKICTIKENSLTLSIKDMYGEGEDSYMEFNRSCCLLKQVFWRNGVKITAEYSYDADLHFVTDFTPSYNDQKKQFTKNVILEKGKTYTAEINGDATHPIRTLYAFSDDDNDVVPLELVNVTGADWTLDTNSGAIQGSEVTSTVKVEFKLPDDFEQDMIGLTLISNGYKVIKMTIDEASGAAYYNSSLSLLPAGQYNLIFKTINDKINCFNSLQTGFWNPVDFSSQYITFDQVEINGRTADVLNEQNAVYFYQDKHTIATNAFVSARVTFVQGDICFISADAAQ